MLVSKCVLDIPKILVKLLATHGKHSPCENPKKFNFYLLNFILPNHKQQAPRDSNGRVGSTTIIFSFSAGVSRLI